MKPLETAEETRIWLAHDIQSDQQPGVPEKEGGPLRLAFTDCQFDSDTREVRRGGAPAPTSPKAFELLDLLVRSRPRVLSKAEIHGRLWPGVFVSDAAARAACQLGGPPLSRPAFDRNEEIAMKVTASALVALLFAIGVVTPLQGRPQSTPGPTRTPAPTATPAPTPNVAGS